MQSLTIMLRCRQESVPLVDAQVLAAYSDGTYVSGETDSEGQCKLDLYRTDDDMTVVAAAAGYKAHRLSAVPDLCKNYIELEMTPYEGIWGNSAIFSGTTGHIQGIEGRLNPHKGLYVYGNNLSINGIAAHPAFHFELKEWLTVRDSKGMECSMRFIVVEGQFSLLEYTTPELYPTGRPAHLKGK